MTLLCIFKTPFTTIAMIGTLFEKTRFLFINILNDLYKAKNVNTAFDNFLNEEVILNVHSACPNTYHSIKNIFVE